MKLFLTLCLTLLAGSLGLARGVTVPPALPGRPASDLYAVTVNGQAVGTEKFRTKFDLGTLPDWFTKETYTGVQQELHFADFSGEGPMEVVLTLSEQVTKAVVHPLSRGIKPSIEGNRVSFSLAGPDKVYVVINDLPPLCVFANPPEGPPPAATAPGVRFFAAGVHRPGLMTLKSNETVYLAPGALVYGGLRAEPGARNLKVVGRGVLDGGFEIEDMVKLEDCHGVEFNGITIRNGMGWTNTLVNCTDVTYRDVKIISFGPSGDGIDPLGSSRVLIDRCFFRCTDDCIAIKSPGPEQVVHDVRITNNTMVGFACSDAVTIGFETNGPEISNVRVQNCDVVLARGGSRVDGHSAFSIICDGPAVIHDIRFEDIRVEEALKAFELTITDGTKYEVNPPGHIRGVFLKNIVWAAHCPILLKGFDQDHRVEQVVFENCTMAGRRLTGPADAKFEINAFAQGIEFR